MLRVTVAPTTCRKPIIAPIVRFRIDQHIMKEEQCVEHATSLQTCKLPLIIFVLISRICSPSSTLLWQTPGPLPTGSLTKTTKGALWQGQCCLLKEKAAPWAVAFQQRGLQEPSRTKILPSIRTKMIFMETKKTKHLVRTWSPANAHKVRPPEPTFTNPKLGPKQLPTRTACIIKDKLEMPWQQQPMPSTKQQEFWQKAEAMSQSLHCSSWIFSVQVHSQRRCTLQTHQCRKDKYQFTLVGK